MVGHIGALERTTTSPSSYLLLAGDQAHLRAQYSCCSGHIHPPYQCGLFAAKTSFNPKIQAKGGLLSLHGDLKHAYETMAKMGRMEEEPGVAAFLAHDIEWEIVLSAEGEWESKNVTNWYEVGWKHVVEAARVHK
jgi:hypothetical protein